MPIWTNTPIIMGSDCYSSLKGFATHGGISVSRAVWHWGVLRMDGRLETGCSHWSMWQSRQIPKYVIIGHWRERNQWNGLLHIPYQMNLNVKYETMGENTGEFIYGLRVRKHPQPQTKAKEGTKRHLNTDRSCSPRNKLCKWPSTRKNKVIRPLKSQEQWKLKHKAPFSHPLKQQKFQNLMIHYVTKTEEEQIMSYITVGNTNSSTQWKEGGGFGNIYQNCICICFLTHQSLS